MESGDRQSFETIDVSLRLLINAQIPHISENNVTGVSSNSRQSVGGRFLVRMRYGSVRCWTVTSTWTIDVSHQLQFARGSYTRDNCYWQIVMPVISHGGDRTPVAARPAHLYASCVHPHVGASTHKDPSCHLYPRSLHHSSLTWICIWLLKILAISSKTRVILGSMYWIKVNESSSSWFF